MQKAFLVLLLAGLATPYIAARTRKHAELQTIAVKRPNVVVRGSYLGTVEIWAVVTGSGISPEGTLVGNAKRSNAAGRKEIWLFSIGCESPLIPSTEVFVKAFDVNGNQVGRRSLPYSGASDIADALCGSSIKKEAGLPPAGRFW
jgi:hypothetical protein